MTLHQDDGLILDERGITITNYLYPGHKRHIPYASIRSHSLIELGPLTGRHRLVGFGFRRPRHFFHWDRKRSRKTHSVALDIGRFVHPVISPVDHHRVLQLLDGHSADRLDVGGRAMGPGERHCYSSGIRDRPPSWPPKIRP